MTGRLAVLRNSVLEAPSKLAGTCGRRVCKTGETWRLRCDTHMFCGWLRTVTWDMLNWYVGHALYLVLITRGADECPIVRYHVCDASLAAHSTAKDGFLFSWSLMRKKGDTYPN
jgi:hypothetical protein